MRLFVCWLKQKTSKRSFVRPINEVDLGLQSNRGLGAADFDGVGSLWGVRNLKADLVTLLKFVELYVHELVGVEKEILFLTFDFDEPESLIGETSYSSCLHRLVGLAKKAHFVVALQKIFFTVRTVRLRLFLLCSPARTTESLSRAGRTASFFAS